MFEDSTFESAGRLHTRSRRWMIATFAFNTAILLALILIPLFYPQALSGRAIPTLMTAPPLLEEQPRPVARALNAAPPPTEMPMGIIQAPRLIPAKPWIPSAPEPPRNPDAASLAPEGSGPDVFHETSVHPNVVQAGPKPIPSVLAAGLLLYKVVPRYPAIPREIHLEGTVVLQATISKNGAIENLRVVSGHPLLQQAALDAVAQWRYRPYLLNGQPVEVETTVNVEFKLQ